MISLVDPAPQISTNCKTFLLEFKSLLGNLYIIILSVFFFLAIVQYFYATIYLHNIHTG